MTARKAVQRKYESMKQGGTRVCSTDERIEQQNNNEEDRSDNRYYESIDLDFLANGYRSSGGGKALFLDTRPLNPEANAAVNDGTALLRT